MKRFKSILCASFLTLAMSSAALAGDIHGAPAPGDIHGRPSSGDIHGRPSSGDIHGRPSSGDIHGRPGDIHGFPDAAYDVLMAFLGAIIG